jgi:hypothetical protein
VIPSFGEPSKAEEGNGSVDPAPPPARRRSRRVISS